MIPELTTALQIVDNGGGYDISKLEAGLRDGTVQPQDEKERTFLEQLIAYKHVLFDAGCSTFWATNGTVVVDREYRVILVNGTPATDETKWTQMDSSRFSELAAPYFSGNSSPTDGEAIARLERSGVTVGPYNTVEHHHLAEKDVDEYMTWLRAQIQQSVAGGGGQ